MCYDYSLELAEMWKEWDERERPGVGKRSLGTSAVCVSTHAGEVVAREAVGHWSGRIQVL